MDTLSHALVGLAVAGLSGHQPAFNDPLTIAAVLGAEAPDFDVIAQLRGSMAYLRQHRAFSHSLPGIILWSGVISGALALLMPHTAIAQAFFWALTGGLSHTVLDYFNTHGTAILWPFRRERKSFPLLNVFDPLLILLLASPHAFRLPVGRMAVATLTVIVLYIGLRCALRQQAAAFLKRRFSGLLPSRLWVMPCLKHLWYWDFVVETPDRHIIGRIGAIHPVVDIKASLPRQEASLLAAKAEKTPVGEFFSTFTPFVYYAESPDDRAKITIYDLRYYADRHFIHSATVIFDEDDTPTAAYVHSLGRTVKITA